MTAAVYAVLVAFFVCAVLCKLFIPLLHRLKFGDVIRDDGPKEHEKKAGTPTMGGIMIILAIIFTSLWFFDSAEALAVVSVTIAFGIIGFLDDFVKIAQKRGSGFRGLRAYQKLLAQIIVASGFVLFWRTLESYSTSVIVPFFPQISLDLMYFYPVFAVLVFLGTTNGSNLTDGIDGMAAGVTAIIAVFFMFVAWRMDSPIMPITGAVVGALLGFLLFNSHPAKVFMGDTGSLALGGFVAATALMLGIPLLLIIIAIVYVIESLSVIIQVTYFKLTGGRRFFKMAPIHHAFELSGWSETKITACSYVITAIAVFLGYIGLGGM